VIVNTVFYIQMNILVEEELERTIYILFYICMFVCVLVFVAFKRNLKERLYRLTTVFYIYNYIS
jgi:hypothetical protein